MYASEIIATIGFFSTLMVLGIMFLRNRHRERLALIQYGRDNTVFNKDGGKNSSLKFGLLLASIGAGLLFGNIIDVIFTTDPVGKFSCVFLLGGCALVYYHQVISGKVDFNATGKFNLKDDEDDDLI